jgi:hypothetical protein
MFRFKKGVLFCFWSTIDLGAVIQLSSSFPLYTSTLVPDFQYHK